MICVRFTTSEGCDISGTLSDLLEVATIIRRLAKCGGSRTVEADSQANPGAYETLLNSLALRITSGPVCATVSGGALEISAGATFMEGFASFFQFEAETPNGHHHHHEYWDGNEYVAPGSTPLVIRVAHV
jgi:hypothetical protein